MIEPDSGKLAAKIAALRAQKAASAPAPAPKKAPRTSDTGPELPEELSYMMESVAEVSEISVSEVTSDQFVDSILSNIGILEAYDRWCSKPRPQTVRDEEEVIVRCPTPSHVDRSPSAALNQAKDVWTCFGCGASGDVIHLVGENKGLDPRIGTEFMELRKAMMRDLGYRTWTNSMGHEEVVVPEWFGKKPATIAPEEKVAPEQEIPVDTVPDELFSDDTSAASAVFEKKTPAELPSVDAEFLTTLDELDDIDGVKDKKDRVLNSFRDKVAKSKGKTAPKSTPETPAEQPSEPEKEVEKPYLTTENPKKEAEIISEVATKPSGTPMKPSRMPKFNLKDSSDPDLPSNKPKQDVASSDSDETSADIDDMMDKVEAVRNVGGTLTVDWRNIIPPNTFIHDYCLTMCNDDSPEELHFWNAVMAVGLALGRDVCLDDRTLVHGNLFLCMVAESGARKTRANGFFSSMIKAAFPFSEELGTGVRHLATPGSGEAMLDQFINEREDPTNSNNPPLKYPVNGLLQASELSGLLEIAIRSGSTLESTMIGLYDAFGPVTASSRGAGTKIVDDAFCTIMTSTQPDRIRDLVTRKMVDSGLANRFFYIFGSDKEEEALGSMYDTPPPSGPLTSKIHHVRENMLSSIPIDKVFGVRAVHWDDVARTKFREFHYSVMGPTKKADETSLAVRTNLLMKKLCLLFTANMGKSSVTPEAVEQAIAMWPYIIKCYQRVGAKINATEGREREERVLTACMTYYRKHKAWPTASKLFANHLKNYKSIENTEQLNRILKSMVEAGQLEDMASERTNGARKYKVINE